MTYLKTQRSVFGKYLNVCYDELVRELPSGAIKVKLNEFEAAQTQLKH